MVPFARRAFARGFLAVVWVAALAVSASAQFGFQPPTGPAVAPCVPFSAFPLALNLGSQKLDGRDGVSDRCAVGQLQNAINSLAGQRGQPNGIATLDGNGLIPLGQIPANPFLPASVPKLIITGSGSTGDISGMSVATDANAPLGTLARWLSNQTGSITPEAYGYVPGSTPAATSGAINAALNAAVAANQGTIWLQNEYIVDGSYTPSDKVGYAGPGRIITPSQYGQHQLTTYADSLGFVVGREYLARAMRRIQQGPSGNAAKLGIYAYGDSTVEGFISTGPGMENYVFNGFYLVQNYLPELFLRQGIISSVTNRGVSGTRWGDLNAIPDLGPTTDLLIIKYGINDGALQGDRLATMAAAMRAKLNAIRSAPYGDLNNLSIILMGPSATDDDINGRNEQWYERVRQVYVEIAREYKAAYFDTYAWMKDARSARTLWLDSGLDPSGELLAVHPLEPAVAAIWGGMVQTMFPKEIVGRAAANRFVLTGSNYENANVNKPPGAYDPGVLIQFTDNTWPMFGIVTTIKGTDNAASQTLADYGQNGRAHVITRTGSGGAWSPWSGNIETLTLGNGWGNLFGANMYAHLVMSAEGIVTLGGEIANGVTAPGTAITTLPAGARPVAIQRFPVATSGGVAVLAVNPDGTVTIESGASAGSLSLSGISFKAQ